jgi:hypothetical protein
MKYPRERDRPGPYTRAQWSNLQSLNHADEICQGLLAQVNSLEEARRHVKVIKTLCTVHAGFVARTNNTNFSTTLCINILESSKLLQKDIAEMLECVIPRNFKALTFRQEVDRQPIYLARPWEPELLQRWFDIAADIMRELHLQIDATICALSRQEDRVSLAKHVAHTSLQDDILEWEV